MIIEKKSNRIVVVNENQNSSDDNYRSKSRDNYIFNEKHEWRRNRADGNLIMMKSLHSVAEIIENFHAEQLTFGQISSNLL